MKKRTIVLVIISLFIIIIFGINNLFDKKVANTNGDVDIQIEETTKGSSTTSTTTTTSTTKKKIKKTTKKTTKVLRTTYKATSSSKSEYLKYAKNYGNLNETQLQCLDYLWEHESNWNANAVNKSSGACGIPQALPCNKISKAKGSNSWQAQIEWGLDYIFSRYKNPCNAWNHFKNKKWY